MVKAWGKANWTRENWMNPERLHVVPEDEEPLEEEQPPVPPDERPEATDEVKGEPEIKEEGQGALTPQGPPIGQVRKLTDYFNEIGGQTTPKAPKKAHKDPKTPGNKEPQGRGSQQEQEELTNPIRRRESTRLMNHREPGLSLL